MRHLLIFCCAATLMSACQPKNGSSPETLLREENFRLKQENDSLKNALNKVERDYSGDTIQVDPPVAHPDFAGKHALTLQWISWDRPGSVMIKPSDNGWYAIEGSQSGTNGNFLKINGKIRPVNDRELEFDGVIESRIDHLYGGESCIRNGPQSFKATGTRKYWRLQNMINCEGGTVTDYVDIYF